MRDLGRGTDARGTSATGVSDRGLGGNTEARRADFRDAYRAGLTSLVTDAELAKDDIATLLIRANGMAGKLAEGWGPRTEYLNAANLLTLYLHLTRRAAASSRDRDGVLLQTDSFGQVKPWSRERPKRVEEILTFRPEAVARWNRIVAQGPPPDYEPPARRGARKPAARAGREVVRTPGFQHQKPIELPFGMHAVVHPGGPDARLIYTLIKTPNMNTTTPEGRLAILEAVVARVLAPRYDESYAAVAARDLMKVSTGGKEGIVYANAPTEFERRSPGMEFTFEVGLTFLMNLDQVTDGAVPWSLISQLDPHVEVKKDEPKPLWQELYPTVTTRERVYWVEKRIADARPLWDPKLGRPKPGAFYPGYSMRYVSDGPFAGDQIWATREYRIYQVNERAALLEAFRIGVLRAAGGVALAYALIGLSLMLIEGPAMLSMLSRIRFPAQLAREFLFALRTRPLALLGNIAVDQGANVILSGGWENYVDSLDEPEGWFNMFFSVLGATHSVLHLPTGPKLRIEGGEFVPVKSAEIPVASAAGVEPGVAAAGMPKTPVEAPKAPVPTPSPRATPETQRAPVERPKGGAPDPGARVLVRTDAPAAKTTAPHSQSGATAAREPGGATVAREPSITAAREPSTAAGQSAPKAAQTTKGTSNTAADATQRTAGESQRATGESRRATDEPHRATDPESTAVKDRGAKDDAERNRAADEDIEAIEEVDVADVAAGGGGRRPRRKLNKRGQDVRGRRDEPPPRTSRGGERRGGAGSRGTRNRGTRRGGPTPTESSFTRVGVEFEVTVSPKDARAYDAIPDGDTVVYGVYDANGEMIYVGITEKTPNRAALARLKEHLTTKEGEFIGEAAEFRLIGAYDNPRQAHALEQDIISERMPRYNKDLEPWESWLRGPDPALIRRRAGPNARSVDTYLRENARLRARGDDIPDVESHVPAPNLDISFEIDL